MISSKPLVRTVAFALALMPTLLLAQRVNQFTGRLPGLNQAIPTGWTLQSSKLLSDPQTQAIATKLNANVARIANSFVGRDGQTIQINSVECDSELDAQAVASSLRNGKSNPRFVTQNGLAVFEFVVRSQRDATLAIQARDAFQIQPASMKLQSIVKWMSSGQHIQFGGEIIGSRYGVEKTLSQKFGHCWDLSDVFITLCRASGIPARQLFGWLHQSSGHAWAEVSVDGKTWIAFDPSGSLPCGSDYIPLATSSTGVMPFIFASLPKIEVVEAMPEP